jgi:sugar O-acyltransferase (sialic acid O-acetyltransferase NeuD family)
MLIVGAKGFAKEVLEVCHQNSCLNNLAFYDDINLELTGTLYSKFPVLKSPEEAKKHFSKFNTDFTIGIGNPKLRILIYEKFIKLGGLFKSTISSTAIIGSFNSVIHEGCNIMQNVVITNDVEVRKGTIINQLTSIGHDVIIGEFCEICPNVSISGNCIIGENTFIGTGAIILPKVKVGKNVIIGAGAVVSKDLPDNCVAVGIPAKIIRQN